MEVKNINKKQARLLERKLFKTKINKKKPYLDYFKVKDIGFRLKKSLHIIYKYHINNKRILFVGTPLYTYPKLKQLVKRTKHTLIPESIWMNGIITNQHACFKYLYRNQNIANKKASKLLLQLKKRNDLIVLLNQWCNLSALNEGYTARVPVISLNSNLDILETKPTYKVPGNFNFTKKKMRNNLFYSVLTAIFKKANKDKTSMSKQRKSKNYKTTQKSELKKTYSPKKKNGYNTKK